MQSCNYLISANITASTMSPLFIGTKNPSYGWGLWRVDKNDNYAYVIDQAKFYDFLEEQGLIDKFVDQYSNPAAFVDQNRRDRELKYEKDWVGLFLNDSGCLKNKNLSEKKEVARKISSGVIYHPASIKSPFIRSGNGKVFIPGSSIKGAFRTAFVYTVLKRFKEAKPKIFEARVEQAVKRKLKEFRTSRDRNRFKQTFDQEIMRTVLYPPGKTLANYDLFRFVKVSDGSNVDDCTTEGSSIILNIGNNHVGLKPTGNGRPIKIPCEYMKAGAEFSFKLTIDTDIHSQLKADLKGATIEPFLPDIVSIEDLFSVVEEFALDQWHYEKKFTANRLRNTSFEGLSDYYTDASTEHIKPFIRLGWGTGMLGMTIDLLFDSSSDGSGGLREEIRNISSPRPGEPAPKSRRLLEQNGTYVPFGWVSLLSEKPL